jgi:hypothetical protein
VTVGRAISWRRRTTLVTRAVTRFEAFKAILRSKLRQMDDSLRRLFRKPQDEVLCCLRPSSLPWVFTHPPLIASNFAVKGREASEGEAGALTGKDGGWGERRGKLEIQVATRGLQGFK